MILREKKEPSGKRGHVPDRGAGTGGSRVFESQDWDRGAAAEDRKEREVRTEVTVKMCRMGRAIGRTLAFTSSEMRNPWRVLS